LEQSSIQVIDPIVLGGLVAGAIFVGVLVFLRVGSWIGARAMARYGQTSPSIGSLETAVFALLGLLIAFSFSGALTRFDMRRAQVVQEANAIGTAYLRLDLLPAAAQPKLRQAFRQYLDSRIATYQKRPDLAAARAELARSQQLQGEIWAMAVAATQQPGARPGVEYLVIQSLNDMIDVTTVRVVATQMHPPSIIYWMLFVLALASAILAGYQSAAEKGYNWVHKIIFAGVVALTVYVILDIEYPRLGLVRIDAIDRVLMDVRAGMR
jgi:hypothetical protein